MKPILMLTISTAAILALPLAADAAGPLQGRSGPSHMQGERLQHLQQKLHSRPSLSERVRYDDRKTRRADFYAALATVDTETVMARLDASEAYILDTLATADPDKVTKVINAVGIKASDRLDDAPLANLTPEQAEQLTAAAAYAASISPEEVEQLLIDGALRVEENFDQADPEHITNRLNEIGEKALYLNESDRETRRTDFATALATTDADAVMARLDQSEARLLDALATADPQQVSGVINAVGIRASDRLEDAPLPNLSPEQAERLTAAAAYAATISPEEVETLLADGSLRVESFFDERDPEVIANALNTIGERALGLEPHT